MKWYFFAWEAMEGDGRGTQVLPFHEEFDLEKAHEFLMAAHGQPMIVTSFVEISKKNAAGYQRFVKRASGPQKSAGLRLIKGNGQ